MSVKTIELDIRGQICPSTLLTALRAISAQKEGLKSGTLLVAIRTDTRDATATIPEAVSNMGYAAAVQKQAGHYLILVGRQDALVRGAEK